MHDKNVGVETGVVKHFCCCVMLLQKIIFFIKCAQLLLSVLNFIIGT